MNGSMLKARILAAGLGACFALAAHAQQNVDWIKTMPPGNSGGAGITTMGPEPEQVRAADPKYRARIHTELASAYFQAGNMAVALEEVRIALEADPENVQAYSMRGLIHAQLKENGKADDDFRRALKIAPKNPDINNNYGWFLCDIGQPRQSIQYFLNALKDPLYETPDVAYTNAGVCAMKGGDLDGAMEYLLQALRLSKNPSPLTRYHMANLMYQRGNLEESRIYLNDAVKAMEPPTPELLWLGVRLERKRGNKEGEGNYASQLRSRHPTSREYQLFLKGNFE